jgi:hypothetical protein
MLKTHDKTEEGNDPMARTRVPIDVTPLFRQGNTVVCDIDPPTRFQKGGNIHLPKDSYTLEFSLQSGTPAGLNFQPDRSGVCDAFWSDSADCPTHAMNNGQYSNPRLTDPTTWCVDVDVASGAPPLAVHYRLNFDNACNFDPIIIHD